MDHSIYDLGNVDRVSIPADSDPPARDPAARRPRRGRPAGSAGPWWKRHAGASSIPPATATQPPSPERPPWGVNLATTLSLFAPGAGQIVRGRPDMGFLFLAGSAFLSSLAWAAWTTRAGLAETLPLLGLSRAWGFRTLLILFGLAAVMHITAFVSAIFRRSGAHPQRGILALASALIPGWGQGLAGHSWRAGLCLGGLWVIGFAWLMSSHPVQSAMAEQNLILPAGVEFITGPLMRYTGPAVLWAVAISDAFHGRDSEV